MIHLALLPLLVVAGAGLVMLLVDAFVKQNAQLGIFAASILGGAAVIALGVWNHAGVPIEDSLHVARFLAADHLALFADITIGLGGALAMLLASGYLREHNLERGEYYVLALFSALGAMALAHSVDMLSVFVSLEALSLGVYCLVAFRRQSPRAAEGAMKYFLLGSFASAILLFGIALLYAGTLDTNFEAMGQAVRSGHADLRLTILGMALVLVGLAFKVSAVPFHMWTPDAYEGAVTPATTFMAVVVKAASTVVLLRVFLGVFGVPSLASGDAGWTTVVLGLAVLTLVVGNLAALVQKSVKRMLAYSSIAHAGFLLIGLAASARGEALSGQGASAVLYYLLAYTVSNVLAFGSLVAVGSRGREATSYEDLAGVGRRHPWIAVPFTLGILSLMGFPPTAGFFAKYWVLDAAVRSGMTWVAIVAVLMSAVGAYYYLRVLVFLFMRQPEPNAPVAVPMRSGGVVAALAIAGYFVLRMGLMPSAYTDRAAQAASSLIPTVPAQVAQAH